MKAIHEPCPDGEAGSTAARMAKLGRDQDALQRILDLLGHVTEMETVDDICRTIVEGVRGQLGFDRVGLHLWHEKEGVFRGTFGTGIDGSTRDEHDLWWPGEGWPPYEEVKKGRIFLEDKLDQPPARAGEEALNAHMVVLRFGERVYGILSVDNRISHRPITEDELKHLTLFSRIVGNAVDLSRARRELADSEGRFRQVAENSREWIWETDREGRYTYSSPVVQDILGYSPAEIGGRSCVDLVSPSCRVQVSDALEQAFRERHSIVRLVNRQMHRGGYEVALETSAVPQWDAAGTPTGLRGAHRDVTARLQMEEQLREVHKMEAVGRLAGGIAHYFNNLLTMIMGCSTLLLDQIGEGSEIREDIEQIRKAGEQAAALTQQLLALSRKQTLRIRRFDVNRVFTDIEQMLRHTLGRGIEFVLTLDPAAPEVDGDVDRFKYVVLHLVINARAAMTETAEQLRLSPVAGGDIQWSVTPPGVDRKLILSTHATEIGAADCENRPALHPGRHVLVSICDTGVGMPEEARKHIFEPFFTTKEVGHGTGLSLSTIYGTVTQMGGDIRVESELGKGTTFHICLPAAKSETKAAR